MYDNGLSAGKRTRSGVDSTAEVEFPSKSWRSLVSVELPRARLVARVAHAVSQCHPVRVLYLC